MSLPNEPITREEMYLAKIAGQNVDIPDEPISRVEMYLDAIAKQGGTGEGDMKKSVYDSDSAVSTAGGIKPFVNAQTGSLASRIGQAEAAITTLNENKAAKTDIARVEDDATASAEITKGTEFYHNSVLYTATTTISQGSAIVTSGSGQNCEIAPTVTEQIQTLDEEKCDNSVIAPVENQSTCQKSGGYAVGEHFIRDGAFCTVTQAISSGGTLTEGTNYTSGDVASVCADRQRGEVTNINENITVDSSIRYFERVGQVVNFKIRFTVNNAFSSGSTAILFYIPTFAVPLVEDIYYPIFNRTAPYNVTQVSAYVPASRAVGINANLPIGTYDIQGCYITK